MHCSNILWLRQSLPAIERIWRRVEADFYGASHVIAQLTQRKNPPISFATWRHGWTYFDDLCHPKLFTNGSPQVMNLVTNDAHVIDFEKLWVYEIGGCGFTLPVCEHLHL